MLLLQDVPSRRAIFGDNYAIPPVLQPTLQDLAKHWVIFGNQYLVAATSWPLEPSGPRQWLTHSHWPAPVLAANCSSSFISFTLRMELRTAEISVSMAANTPAACWRDRKSTRVN